MNRFLSVLLSFAFTVGVFAQDEPFALGADISWIQQRENGGVRYYHDGVQQDPFAILKDHGFNYIRLRLFVDPTAKIPNESESPYSAAGYCGLDSTIKMAKRIKAADLKFLLDFHYSDTWADPAKQYKPMSWQSLTTLAQLTAKVRSYTKESLEAFKSNGVLPDMVQIGNETVGGMIWDVGRNYSPGSWSNFAALVNAGIDGVKDVDANVKIMVHTINERNPNGWLTSLKNNGVSRVDVFGLSYYTKWHGQPDSLQRVAAKFAADNASNNMKIAVAEYTAKYHERVNDIIFNLPNNKGFGTFIWEPADWNDNDSGVVLFDWRSGTNSGRHANAYLDDYIGLAAKYGTQVSSSSSVVPSSSSSAEQSSSSGTTAIRSIIADIPPNAKIEVYNLRGERIYGTPAQGVYVIITILPSNNKTKRLFYVH